MTSMDLAWLIARRRYSHSEFNGDQTAANLNFMVAALDCFAL
jgi:hypothetical protein